jgi:CDP-diglyceride synthetase
MTNSESRSPSQLSMGEKIFHSRGAMSVALIFFFMFVCWINIKITAIICWVIFIWEISGAHTGTMAADDNLMKKLASLVLLSYLTFCTYCFLSNYKNGGFKNVAWLCLICGACDSSQYLIGRKIGMTKIFAYSPKKSLEGYIGGMIIAGCFIKFMSPSTSMITTVAMLFSMCAGDAVCSIWKRLVKLKDFSDLMGSHGGFLDRLDAQCALQLFAYIVMDGRFDCIQERGIMSIVFWIVTGAVVAYFK